MKRSEMVEEIYYLLLDGFVFSENGECQIEPPTVADLEEKKARADLILSTIENLGMLPPRIDFMIGEMRASDNAWESEDG